MIGFICFSLLSWSAVVLSTPLKTKDAPMKRQDNTNSLVDDGNGSLVPGVYPAGSQDGLPFPGDMIYESDGSAPSRGDQVIESPSGSILNWMNTYHATQKTTIVFGPPMKITEDVDCTGVSCSQTQTTIVTVTDSFQLTVGVDIPINIAVSITNAIKATAKLGVSKTWTTATASTSSRTWTPERGTRGHVVFFPYMFKACGPTYITGATLEYNTGYFDERVSGIYPNTCGYTPMTLADGRPDGVSLITSFDLYMHELTSVSDVFVL
ncbi:hypothetical protein F4677DRAFT_407833 [Hypoxylon crocopeplum]|nr:hypothetical protein F4677DRAFT_407833 [Hypoxylon crocopeplum]